MNEKVGTAIGAVAAPLVGDLYVMGGTSWNTGASLQEVWDTGVDGSIPLMILMNITWAVLGGIVGSSLTKALTKKKSTDA